MKFKPGDKIKCIRAESGYFGTAGETYTVRAHQAGQYGYEEGLTVEGSQKYNIDEARFELVTNNQESEGSNMKIVKGSKVRIKPQHADKYFKLGDIFTVTDTFVVGGDTDRISIEKDSTGGSNGWCTKYFDLVNDGSILMEAIAKYNEGEQALGSIVEKYGKQVMISNPRGGEYLLSTCTVKRPQARILPKVKNFRWLNYDCNIEQDQIKIGCKSFKLDSLVKELGSALGYTKIDTDNTIGYFVSRTGIELEGNKYDWSQIEKLYRLIQEHNS